MSDDDIYLSVDKIALLFNKSERTIYRWIEDIDPSKKQGRYSVKDIIDYREVKGSLVDDDINRLKLRLLCAKADMAELSYQKELKNVIPLEDAREQFYIVIDNVKSGLFQLPDKFRQRTNISLQDSRLLDKMIKDVLMKASK